MNSGCAIRMRIGRSSLLQFAAAVIRPHAECMATNFGLPLITPLYPSQGTQRRVAQLGFLPRSIVHLDLNFADAARSCIGNASNRNNACSQVLFSNSHCVDYRGGLGNGLFAPAPIDPVTRAVMIYCFQASDPFRLFHAIMVRNEDP